VGVYTDQDRAVLNKCKRPLDESRIVATRLFPLKRSAKDLNERMFNELPDSRIYQYYAKDWASCEKAVK
ncbi:hypothetical protein HK405_002741, partial [Cladochytrium tenue]